MFTRRLNMRGQLRHVSTLANTEAFAIANERQIDNIIHAIRSEAGLIGSDPLRLVQMKTILREACLFSRIENLGAAGIRKKNCGNL